MGVDKALLKIDGETMLARTVRVVSEVVSDVLIVGRASLPPDVAGTPAIEDRFGEVGPLGGIATGLAAVRAERAVVVSCDLPLLQPTVLRLLLSLSPEYDAVIPVTPEQALDALPHPRARAGTPVRPCESKDGVPACTSLKAQTTCAVYARSCVPAMLSRLEAGSYRLGDVLGELRVRWLSADELGQVDPEGRSVLNANTPNDWTALTGRQPSR